MSETNLLDVVRVKDPKTGAEYNATRAHAKTARLEIREGEPVRDERTGLPTPPRPTPGKARTDKAGQSTRTQTQASMKKEL